MCTFEKRYFKSEPASGSSPYRKNKTYITVHRNSDIVIEESLQVECCSAGQWAPSHRRGGAVWLLDIRWVRCMRRQFQVTLSCFYHLCCGTGALSGSKNTPAQRFPLLFSLIASDHLSCCGHGYIEYSNDSKQELSSLFLGDARNFLKDPRLIC